MRYQAIYNTHPTVNAIYEETYAVDAEGNSVVINEELVTAEVSRLQAEYDAQTYARSRVQEYPPIGDQLDALFKAGVFPAEMAAAIQAVKDKYPKGGAV